MNDHRAEAAALFNEAINAITRTPKDVELAVRKYAMACELLAWRAEADAAWLELNGYPVDNVGPRRLVKLKTTWLPDFTLGIYDRTHVESWRLVSGKGAVPTDGRIDWYLPAGLADLRRHAADFVIDAGTSRHQVRYQGRDYPYQQVIKVTLTDIQELLDKVERWVFRASVDAVVSLRHGSQVETLWGAMHAVLDGPLAVLALSDHLTEIDRGIAANTPAGRKSALYACRSLLQDLGDRLWRDPRPTYTPLPGQGAGGRLDVTTANPKNRLSAYLHQHLGSTTVRGYLDAELDRHDASLRSLYDLTNDAHAQPEQIDAEMAVVGMYQLLAEMAHRTGLTPIEQYRD